MVSTQPVTVLIKPVHASLGQSLPMPQRMSEHAAGFDVAAALDEAIVLEPLGRALVPCGFAIAIPHGYEVQVRPRSGLAFKHGVTVLNSPGTIDSDYRGEVKVLLINLGPTAFKISPGERIAQLVVAPVTNASIEVVTELDSTARGVNGFGSTGR